MHQAGRGGGHHLTEAGVGDVTVDRRRTIELGVVKDVECLDAQLQPAAFETPVAMRCSLASEVVRRCSN